MTYTTAHDEAQPDDVTDDEAYMISERTAEVEAAQEAADDAAESAYYEYVSDVEMGMYDDDPNPYHGDYSEM